MILIKQPTLGSCMSACLSMITKIDMQEVMRDFHPEYIKRGKGSFSFAIRYLFERGFSPLTGDDFEDGHIFNSDYAYVVALPSLQDVKQWHAIVLYFDDRGELQVLDPLYGQRVKYYCIGEYAHDVNAVDISSLDIELDFAIKLNKGNR